MFILNLIKFFLFSLIFFTIPGLFVIDLLGDIKLRNYFFATAIGFVTYSMISYSLHLINLAILIPLVLIVVDGFFISKKAIPNIIIKKPDIKTLFLVLVAAIGIVGQLLIIFPSGSIKNGNLLFYSAHGHDGMWHVSVANAIANGFPLKLPIMAGEKLTNYHFFSDLSLSDFENILGLPILDLYFKFFPILFTILLTGLSFLVGSKLTKNNFWAGFWSMFFVVFSGSFGFIVTLLKNGTIGGESIFWATQIQSSSGNPPQIVSNIIVLCLILLAIQIYKNNMGKEHLLLPLLLGSLAVFKIYAAIPLYVGFGFLTLTQLINYKNLKLVHSYLVSIVVTLVLYLPNVSFGKTFIIYQPWWYIRTMIVEPSRLNLVDWELRRQTYIFEDNFKRVIFLETVGFLIFILGNLGTKIIGFLWFIKNILVRKDFFPVIFFFTIALTSLVFPLVFLQSGVAGNTSQTLQYFLLVFALTSGLVLGELFSKKINTAIKIVIFLLIVLVSIPTQVGLIYDFYSKNPTAKISESELKALTFLNENTPDDSVILTMPYDKNYHSENGGIPDIWEWFDTSYVSALSKRITYFSDYEQLDIMGYDYRSRLDAFDNLSDSSKSAFEVDIPENVDYIYLTSHFKDGENYNEPGETVYENDVVRILKTQ